MAFHLQCPQTLLHKSQEIQQQPMARSVETIPANPKSPWLTTQFPPTSTKLENKIIDKNVTAIRNRSPNIVFF